MIWIAIILLSVLLGALLFPVYGWWPIIIIAAVVGVAAIIKYFWG